MKKQTLDLKKQEQIEKEKGKKFGEFMRKLKKEENWKKREKIKTYLGEENAKYAIKAKKGGKKVLLRVIARFL